VQTGFDQQTAGFAAEVAVTGEEYGGHDGELLGKIKSIAAEAAPTKSGAGRALTVGR
jgi:hypothetical protein